MHRRWVDNVEVKKHDIEDEDLLSWLLSYKLLKFHFVFIKVTTKNLALFQFCIYFGILVLLNQKKMITLSYDVQASLIDKKDKYL